MGEPSFVTIRRRPEGDRTGYSSGDSTVRGCAGCQGRDGSSVSCSHQRSQYGSLGGSPPRARHPTHDINKAKYHMADVGEFAKSLEESALKAFPNRGRPTQRYSKVQALLIQWEFDDIFVEPEVQGLGHCFQFDYNFEVEYFKIPSDNSHLELMMKIGLWVKQFEQPDTLLIVYYGGHARIDESRQSTWHATRRPESPWLQWSAIQTLLERSPSDVLILLDCCAGAASATFPNGMSITETISASSWEAIAPEPGRFSFTSTLLEVLAEWKGRAFSAAMLHAEMLARLKHPRREMHNGRPYEARSTPVHFMMTANHKAPSIEISKKFPEPHDPQPASSPSVSPVVTTPVAEMEGGGRLAGDEEVAKYSPEPTMDSPHVMISLALEEDQRLDINAWEQWLSAFPALAKYVKIQGVFKSHSNLLLLSLPIMLWDMLPEDNAINFIAFIRSNNLLKKPDSVPVAQTAGVGQPVHQATQLDNLSVSRLTGTTYTANQEFVSPLRQPLPQPVQKIIGGMRSIAPPTLEVEEPQPSSSKPSTGSGIRNLQLFKKNPLSLLPAARSTSLKLSPSMSSLQQPAHLPSSSSSMIGPEPSITMVPIMNTARLTRHTNVAENVIPKRPNLAPHVEARLEEYYTRDPYPADGIREMLASSSGVEVGDVSAWFHHKNHEELVARRFQNLEIQHQPLVETMARPDGVRMVLPGHFSELLEICPPGHVLLVDLRSPKEYAKIHFQSALNLRTPVNFVEAATLELVETSLENEQERELFRSWMNSKCVVFYDRKVEYTWEAPVANALVLKFRAKGWAGQAFVLKGSFKEIQLNHDKYLVGSQFPDRVSGPVKKNLSLEEQSTFDNNYNSWLQKLQDEDRVPQSSLAPGKDEDRRREVEEKQHKLEEEFAGTHPSLWNIAQTTRHSLIKGVPAKHLERSYSDPPPPHPSALGDDGDSFIRKAPLVEPLSRALEGMREGKSGMTSPSPALPSGAKGKGKAVGTGPEEGYEMVPSQEEEDDSTPMKGRGGPGPGRWDMRPAGAKAEEAGERTVGKVTRFLTWKRS